MSAVAPGGTADIGHYCVTVENFSVDRVLKVLATHGVQRGEGHGRRTQRRSDEGARAHARAGERRGTRRHA